MLKSVNPLFSTQKNTDYVEQRISNLRFCLYEGEVSPDYFRIFRQSHLKRSKYQADFWIIGSSHVVTIETEAEKLTEVVSADQNRLPTSGQIYALNGFRNQQFRHSPYCVDLELKKYDYLHSFEKEFQRLIDCQSGFRLQQMFPQSNFNSSCLRPCLPPSTTIDILRADDTALAFRTLHTYTEELAIAITMTQIELP